MPHKPEAKKLQIVGNVTERATTNTKQNNENTEAPKKTEEDTWINQEILYKSTLVDDTLYGIKDESLGEGILGQHPDVISQPIFGPAIIFGGQMARWTGNNGENSGIIALESRLNFETKAGKRVAATFEIFNCGTTSIYFDWRVRFFVK